MKQSIIWVCVVWLLFSCGRPSNVNSLEGTYIGYFHHNYKDTVQVSLLFQDNQYSGFRDKKFCPTLGKGVYEQSDNSISFEGTSNEKNNDHSGCPELKGEYSYEINADGSVRIWKKEGNAVNDEYILRKSNDESLVYGMASHPIQ
jgi:hypothetical protein